MPNTSLTLVTSNPQKAKEIQAALRLFSISMKVSGAEIPEKKALDLREVIVDKVEKAFAHVQRPLIVDDTGIFFVGYHHFPGAYSRFAFQALGFDGLFRLVNEGQQAYFKSLIAFKAARNVSPKIFQGICRGRLTKKLHGRRKPHMPYDNFFIPDGDQRTFAQMSIADKQRYDHRSKAVRAFARFYLRHTT